MDSYMVKYFLAVASGETVEETAAMYHISPSSVSKMIKKLEQEIGVSLLDRTQRKVALTPAGRFFYEGIKPIDLAIDNLLRELVDSYEMVETIRLCAQPSFSLMKLFPVVSEFASNYPQIHFSFADKKTFMEPRYNINLAMSEAVRSGSIDFLFMHRTFFDFSDVYIEDIYDDRLVAIMSKEHPLSEKQTVTVGDLRNETICMTEVAEMYRYSLGKLPKERRATLYVKDLFVGTVGNGIVLCMASEYTRDRFANVTARFVDEISNCPISIMWSKDRELPEYMQRFMDYIIERVKNQKYNTFIREIEAEISGK